MHDLPKGGLMQQIGKDAMVASEPVSRRFSRYVCTELPWMTGNWMTMIGLGLLIPMIACFMEGDIAGGTVFGTVAGFTDLFDGWIARFQESQREARLLMAHGSYPGPITRDSEEKMSLLERLGHRGTSSLGEVLDPIRDKIFIGSILWIFGFRYLDTRIIMSWMFMACLLTVIRPVKAKLKLGDGKANWFGKRKFHVEVTGVVLLVLIPEFEEKRALCEAVFLLALLASAGSLYGHLAAARGARPT